LEYNKPFVAVRLRNPEFNLQGQPHATQTLERKDHAFEPARSLSVGQPLVNLRISHSAGIREHGHDFAFPLATGGKVANDESGLRA
jgi:hypothetical protein